MNNYTTLTFTETVNGKERTVTIKVSAGDLTINDMIEDLVVPMLLGAGYNSEVVSDVMRG